MRIRIGATIRSGGCRVSQCGENAGRAPLGVPFTYSVTVTGGHGMDFKSNGGGIEMQSSQPRIAIIGAGITGLACAHALRIRGHSPTILEKSRGIGGRLATRRAEDGLTFDHGGQYLTVGTDGFSKFLEPAARSGALRPWYPRGKAGQEDGHLVWYAGVPAMNALAKPMCADLDIRLGTQVRAIAPEAGLWRLDTDDTSDALHFDIVICTAPAPQTQNLLAFDPGIRDELARVTMAPCWAAMLAFATPLATAYDIRRDRSHPLEWICRDSSKPGRHASGDCWVLHAETGWTRERLEAEKEDVARMLTDAFAQTLPGRSLPEPVHATAHRWRYARTVTPLGAPFLASNDRTLFAGGDWCLGPAAESGFQSGAAIAGAVADRLAGRAAS